MYPANRNRDAFMALSNISAAGAAPLRQQTARGGRSFRDESGTEKVFVVVTRWLASRTTKKHGKNLVFCSGALMHMSHTTYTT